MKFLILSGRWGRTSPISKGWWIGINRYTPRISRRFEATISWKHLSKYNLSYLKQELTWRFKVRIRIKMILEVSENRASSKSFIKRFYLPETWLKRKMGSQLTKSKSKSSNFDLPHCIAIQTPSKSKNDK